MRRVRSPVVFAALLLPVSLQAQARIAGTVVDRESELPLADVRITVEPGSIERITDAGGRFALPPLDNGTYVVRFEHFGHVERVDTLRVTRPGEVDGRITLAPAPVELDPLDVEATASPVLARAGFYERRADGLSGTFLDRREIEKQDPKKFTDLFFSVRGVSMRNRQIGMELIRFRREVSMRGASDDGCIPDLYIDGHITGGAPGSSRLESHNIVDPSAIEGVEVYVGASTPIAYKNACGVILVWTRRGR